jgi:hypothetical protein
MLKTVSSLGNSIGALVYRGTWNASTNNPTLASGIGTKGDYYVVNVAGSTNLDGETLWGVGDMAVFNGTVWQKVDGGDTSTVTQLTVTTATGYLYANNTSPATASTTIPVASVTGAVPNTVTIIAGSGLTGTGNLSANVTLSVTANSTNQNVTVRNAGTTVASQPAINFISGNNVVITTGNDTTNLASNVTVSVNAVNVSSTIINGTTAASASFITSSLPLVPAGYILVNLNGTNVKIPYYSV